MQQILDDLRSLLNSSTCACLSDSIALSGGLDSSILASCIKNKEIRAFSVVVKDFASSDLMYTQLAAKSCGLNLTILQIGVDELLEAVNQTIKILHVFNPIEIRNNVVMYLVMKNAKNNGYEKMITGDGADELFAGYNFFKKLSLVELDRDLKRIWGIMHFPSRDIAYSLGITLCTPFLDDDVMNFAKKIKTEFKVRQENGKNYGKWILRKSFENVLPTVIVWREKAAMQDGSGTAGLTTFLDNSIAESDFLERAKKYEKDEKVKLLSKESLYYYEIYRRYYDMPANLIKSELYCPSCNYGLLEKTHFCRMCGSFPI